MSNYHRTGIGWNIIKFNPIQMKKEIRTIYQGTLSVLYWFKFFFQKYSVFGPWIEDRSCRQLSVFYKDWPCSFILLSKKEVSVKDWVKCGAAAAVRLIKHLREQEFSKKFRKQWHLYKIRPRFMIKMRWISFSRRRDKWGATADFLSVMIELNMKSFFMREMFSEKLNFQW